MVSPKFFFFFFFFCPHSKSPTNAAERTDHPRRILPGRRFPCSRRAPPGNISRNGAGQVSLCAAPGRRCRPIVATPSRRRDRRATPRRARRSRGPDRCGRATAEHRGGRPGADVLSVVRVPEAVERPVPWPTRVGLCRGCAPFLSVAMFGKTESARAKASRFPGPYCMEMIDDSRRGDAGGDPSDIEAGVPPPLPPPLPHP
jgi:hypothetical protein